MRTLSTVEKAIDVLFALAGNQAGLGVTEIGTRLALKKSTAHQFLASLRKKELIEQDPTTRQYRLSPRVLRLSMAYLNHLDLPHRVLPFLRKLQEKSGETVILNMRGGKMLIHVAQVEGKHAVRRVVEIGGFQPLEYGAPATAVLAFLPESEAAEILKTADKGANSSGSKAASGPGKVTKEALRRVRQEGYAMSFGKVIKGVHAMAVPVFDSDDSAVGCVTISGPADRFTLPIMRRQIQPLLEAANRVSLAFGSARVLGRREAETAQRPKRKKYTAA